jgi:hypothetical protein
VLRGESADAAGEAVPSTGANNPLALLFAHVSQAIAAPREDPGHHASFPRGPSGIPADPARPSVVSPRHSERWGGAPRPDVMIRTVSDVSGRDEDDDAGDRRGRSIVVAGLVLLVV